MDKKEIGIKKSLGLSEAISYLKDLCTSLEKGEVYIQQGSEYLALNPQDRVFVEAKAKRKKDKEKFSLSISWYNQQLAAEGEDIKISSQRPEGDVQEIEDTDNDE